MPAELPIKLFYHMSSKPADKFLFLVDVNLPKKFRFFNNTSFIHIVDINPAMTDKKIWEFAIENNYVILTKDTDFYDLFLVSDIHPKIIYFQLGNYTMSELYQYFSNHWVSILDLLPSASFIIADPKKVSVFI